MTTRRQCSAPRASSAENIVALIRAARRNGLAIGRAVNIGVVPGVIVGYNIARSGPYPATRFPLLVRTELGTGKFALSEVAAA